ncbi:MAG: hypothetical protein QOI80_2855 [Solirubrobacteraceae bacterium]|nr:hypothetical protein [Solirubrobacteraceae bacterium]
MTVDQLVPTLGPVEIRDVLSGLQGAPRRQDAPFHPARIDFSDAVSRAIFRHPGSRAFPELLAVAFWLRRAAVSRLAERFGALEAAGPMRAPRGLAFHVPPTNVDTLFVYSLMASFLVGNLNVVRVSRDRPTEQVALLCEVLRTVLAEDGFADFAGELAVVSYGHEPEPTAALSLDADVRLVWGGDATVDRLRAVPSTAHDLAFGDRFSFAALRPDPVMEADEPSRHRLAEQLFNDAYWFDQMGCASPRLIVWVGEPGAVEAARGLLLAELARVIAEKDYRLQPGAAIAKLTFLYGALIDRPVARVHQAGNELAVLTLEHLDGFDRTHPGAGLFFEARVDALGDLVGFVARKDQTLTALGFSTEELSAFARSLNGRGIDRIVGFGDALSFDSFWDGYDLLAELTRTVTVDARVSRG